MFEQCETCPIASTDADEQQARETKRYAENEYDIRTRLDNGTFNRLIDGGIYTNPDITLTPEHHLAWRRCFERLVATECRLGNTELSGESA